MEIDDVKYEVVKDYDKTIRVSNYEEKQINEIINWKRQKPSVLNKTFGLVSKPFAWASSKFIPSIALEGVLKFSNLMAQRLSNKEEVVKKSGVNNIEELRYKSLEFSDKLADEIHVRAIKAAVIEGGSTGAFGIAGMAVDVPAIITLALNMIIKIGICYGYECESKRDTEFCMAILSASSSNSLEEKATALGLLRSIEITLAEKTWGDITIRAARKKLSKEAGIIAARNLSRQLGVNLSKRKVLASIPVIGAAIGGSINGWFIKEVGWAARRSFQERWLLENGKIDEDEYYKSILL